MQGWVAGHQLLALDPLYFQRNHSQKLLEPTIVTFSIPTGVKLFLDHAYLDFWYSSHARAFSSNIVQFMLL